MAQVPITETDEYTATAYKPQDLLDGVTVASLMWSAQAFANRTRWLRNELVSRGVQRVRTFLTTADLQNATCIPYDVALTPLGLFVALSTSPQRNEPPLWHPSATNPTVSWANVAGLVAGVAGGLAKLDGYGRLPLANAPSLGLVGLSALAGGGSFSVSTTEAVVTDSTMASAGDASYILVARWDLQVTWSSGGGATDKLTIRPFSTVAGTSQVIGEPRNVQRTAAAEQVSCFSLTDVRTLGPSTPSSSATSHWLAAYLSSGSTSTVSVKVLGATVESRRSVL